MEFIKKIKINILLFLVLSLIILIPLEISLISATENGGGSDLEQKSSSSFSNGFQTVGEISSNVCGPPTSVKGSLILSIVTLCIPGILEKLYDWKQIKCETVVCYYNSVKNGLDPGYCKKYEGYQVCKFVIGEIFALPPMAILEYVRQWVAQILANPVGVLWGAFNKILRAYYKEKEDYNSLIDAAPAIYLGIVDIMGAMQTLQEMMENGFFPDPEDKCEQIPDIIEEMEEILKYAK